LYFFNFSVKTDITEIKKKKHFVKNALLKHLLKINEYNFIFILAIQNDCHM